jgi:hypothetical protein
MNKIMPIRSPFTSCGEGHDLTKPNAYIYDNQNKQHCRECITKVKKVRKSAKGSFS